jgi:LysM repeat protein
VGRLRIPAQYYVIRSGDTLDAIAARFATTVDALLALNPGVEPTTLRPGQRLRIK